MKPIADKNTITKRFWHSGSKDLASFHEIQWSQGLQTVAQITSLMTLSCNDSNLPWKIYCCFSGSYLGPGCLERKERQKMETEKVMFFKVLVQAQFLLLQKSELFTTKTRSTLTFLYLQVLFRRHEEFEPPLGEIIYFNIQKHWKIQTANLKELLEFIDRLHRIIEEYS